MMNSNPYNKNTIRTFLDRFLTSLSLPVLKEFPFLIIFFCLISVSSIKFLLAGILNGNVDTVVFEHFSRALSISYLLSLILYITKSKTLKVVFYTIGVCLFSITIFLWIVFHLIISPQIITFIGETNTGEASEFLKTFLFSWKGILCLLITLIISISIIICEKSWPRIIEKLKGKLACIRYINVIILICVLIGISHFDIYYDIAKSQSTDDLSLGDPMPYDAVTSSLFSLHSIKTTKNEMKNAVKVSLSSEGGVVSEQDSLDVILVIGESYIKYHSQVYGYYLPTTPFLKEEEDKGNLFVFNNAISAFNATSQTLRNMLSCNSLDDKEKWFDKPFFPIVFRKSGFNVSYWDIQLNDDSQTTDAFTLKSFLFNKDLAKSTYTNIATKQFRYDDDLVTDYEHTKINRSKYNLTIFHLWGQHIDASERYPHERQFERFTYKDIKNDKPSLTKDKRKDIANYDNATYYNDCVLKHIISLFKNKNSVLVYLSDHGEEMYDYRDSKGRVNAKDSEIKDFLKYQYNIPLMIWCSDKYKTQHSDFIKQISDAVNKPFMSDNICNLMFHLSSLKTIYYHPERDILSPHYIIRDRILGSGINYDKVMK